MAQSEYASLHAIPQQPVYTEMYKPIEPVLQHAAKHHSQHSATTALIYALKHAQSAINMEIQITPIDNV